MPLVPRALSTAMNRISGVSTNSFRINPIVGSGTVNPGQQIRLLLPTAGFIHLPSTKLYFSVTTTGNGTRLPQFTSSLISRVQVLCGGVTLTSGTSVHGVVECVKNIVKDKKRCLVSEHPEMVMGADYLGKVFDYAALGTGIAGQTSAAAETYSTGLAASQPVFSVDLGDFFQSMKPEYIDLALMGQIEVIITTAEKTVLSNVKGTFLNNVASDNAMTDDGAATATATYTLESPVCIVNMVSLLDGSYPMALRQKILDTGFVQYHFNEHIAFQQRFNGNTRFNLAAASLNKLHTVFRLTDALTIGGAIPIAGTASARVGLNGPAGYNWLGAGYAAATGKASFQGKFQQFQLPCAEPDQTAAGSIQSGAAYDYSTAGTTGASPCELQYRINSTQVPNTFLSPQQVAEVCKYANNLEGFDNINSFVEYLFNKFVLSYRFDLITDKFEVPTVSGLDSRNSNSMIEVVSNGGNVDLTNYDSIVLADITKMVRVGEGKQLETIS